MVEPDRPQMTMQFGAKLFAYWITKSKNINQGYAVLIVFA
jgi:hypothetical protein